MTGPVFSRIFNSGETDGLKLKHVIEPVFAIRRRSAIDVFDRIVQLESPDYIVGNVWEFSYGLNNRLLRQRTSSREVLNVALNQSYYTDARARNTISSIRAAATTPPRRASHGARPPGAPGAHRTAAGRLPDRVGSDVQDAEDIRRQRQHQHREVAGVGRVEPEALH